MSTSGTDIITLEETQFTQKIVNKSHLKHFCFADAYTKMVEQETFVDTYANMIT